MWIFVCGLIAFSSYWPIVVPIEDESFSFYDIRQSVQQSEGRKQYLLIKSHSNLPEYGLCWTQAIQQIDATCARLTDRTQASLALKFTKCFMDMSGGDGIGDIELCHIDDAECLRRLPERVFQAYTQFYTHTQNICFYLMHQVWHAETEQTINLLRTHSQSVSKQLEMAGRLQMNLLQQQREGLKVQRELVKHGLNLSEALIESRGSLARLAQQFRNSTIEHGRQLGDVFQRLAQLHNWFVGEYTFIEQILYYSMLLLVIVIFTTAKRSENCRFVLFLVVAVNLALECLLQKYLGTDYFIEDMQIVLFERLWILRKLFMAIMFGIYVTMAALYVDSQRMSLNLLQRIHDQNTEVLRLLRTMNATDANDAKREKVESIEKEKAEKVRARSLALDHFRSNIKLIASSNGIKPVDELPEHSFDRIREEIGIATRLRPRRATPKI